MLKGIDISHHQKGIDLGAITTDFVIIKATEGNGYTDEMCDTFYQKAKSLGKKLGVYHFARPDLGNSAEAEADWFLKETEGYHKEAVLVLDWESGDLGNVAWAKAWLDRVYSKTGIKPMIYMSESPANSYDWSSVANADYGIWVAKYGVNNGLSNEEPTVNYWPIIAMWQYTSKGLLSGYSGNLDLNYFYGDESAWDKYAGSDSNNNSNSTTSNNSTADQVLYPGSKVQFYGCQIEDIQTKGNVTTFYSSKYGTWLPITPFYRVDENGNRYENQQSSKGNWLRSDSIFTVKSVSTNPDRAVIEIDGKDYSVLSSGLYEVSNK